LVLAFSQASFAPVSVIVPAKPDAVSLINIDLPSTGLIINGGLALRSEPSSGL